MITFEHEIDGFYTIDLYYEGTDSMYVENKHWNKIDIAWLFEKKSITR